MEFCLIGLEIGVVGRIFQALRFGFLVSCYSNVLVQAITLEPMMGVEGRYWSNVSFQRNSLESTKKISQTLFLKRVGIIRS